MHRDLKPANLFLAARADGSSTIKVLDFGISKVSPLGGARSAMTHTSALLGSPIYMSPEQLRSSRSVDARTDVWALGIILYELLTGRPPFSGETLGELFVAIMEHTPQPIARPDVPRGLEEVIFGCLARDPAARVPNVLELARALLPFAHASAQASLDRISGTLARQQVTATGSVSAAWGRSTAPPRKRSAVAFITAVMLFVGAAAIGVIALLHFRHPARRPCRSATASPSSCPFRRHQQGASSAAACRRR